ncbi:DUF5082 domain-containing protein [Bacillus sp. T33-2]|uniref:DUF5082 domain-containing protein n=1 Tax=Bacillus sp. T33-2 TaxID=2054168 RepID=UPI000C789293|nr:DUF5082 domain-containing protein [Bacillus sp. T33-2]PLR94621.1 DUF5082 domain-containing protein [Bacillus sp. T33-2]
MSLSYFYAKLRKKQMHLQRLIRCEGELSQHQQDFIRHERLCTTPELSAVTWEGDLASWFDRIRENNVLTEYQGLSGSQFNHVFRVLSKTIEQIEQEIERIRQMIAALESEERRDSPR